MKLRIGQNIGDNNVRLEYKSSPTKPDQSPSYIIEKSKADEFVRKYNSQEENLSKGTFFTAGAGAVTGGLLTLRNHAYKSKYKILKPLIGIPVGILTGILLSSVVSSEMKSNLMDKYNVKKYN